MSSSIPIVRTAIGAGIYGYVLKAELLRGLSALILAYLTLKTIPVFFSLEQWVVIGLTGLSFLVMGLVGLNTHRIVILGAGSQIPYALVRWSSREFAYWWRSFTVLLIGWGILTFGAMLPFSALLAITESEISDAWWGMDPRFVLVYGPFGILALYVLARLSLVFPQVATDRPTSFRLAWTQSRGNGLRLLVLVVFLPFALDIGVRTGYEYLASAFHELIQNQVAVQVIYVVLLKLVTLTAFVLGVILLSLSYAYVDPEHPTRSTSVNV